MSFRQVRSPLCLIVLSLLSLTLFSGTVIAQPPGYYDSVDDSNPTTLRATLHQVIDDHTRFPYTSGGTDTWDILELADEDPSNASRILDIYKNATFTKAGGGNPNYNREHLWPSSYGFPIDDGQNYPYTDCHILRLCFDDYNTARSNRPFRICDGNCTEEPTDFNDGRGGGSGTYPGNSNWVRGFGEAGTWEVWNGRRGDVARAMFYMDLRYEGGTHNGTGAPEPNLILTDNGSLIQADVNNNKSVAYMGLLAVLLQWHAEDPVDQRERDRNDIVFGFQGNRNPFVDHPEWVDCLFSGNCGSGGAPAAPTGLVAMGGPGYIDLDWNDNAEFDVIGYDVFRAVAPGGPYFQRNDMIVVSSDYQDTGLTVGTTYYYVVIAKDDEGLESGLSNEASASSTSGASTTPWINEIHYDNTGGDVNEAVEIAGPAGFDLSGWTLFAYDGATGTVYSTLSLSGTIPDQQSCVGVLSFAFAGLQDGTPDGIALVSPTNTVIQFLSYEGVIFGLGGPAFGQISTDIGVSEDPGTPVGQSLQLGGTGAQSSAFTWQAATTATAGVTNNGQVFSGGCTGDTTPPLAPSGLSAQPGNNRIVLDWSDNGEPDLYGYRVYRSDVSGGPYSPLTVEPFLASSYTDNTAVNGTTYYYVVTAFDLSDNESASSGEAAGTPAPGPIANVWINELHYQNVGADTGELIEIAGTPGQSLNGWSLVGYNGFGGGTYKTVELTGSLPFDGGCAGVRVFAFPGFQDGDPDGVALIDDSGRVVEFLSYGGTFTAANGPAAGTLSVDIGFVEPASNPLGFSLQRVGSGYRAIDFTWQAPAADSPRSVNVGQSFQGCGSNGGGPKGPGNGQNIGGGIIQIGWIEKSPPRVPGLLDILALEMPPGFVRG
ncbi:MAG: endonuclease [Planctomycetota bacterium]